MVQDVGGKSYFSGPRLNREKLMNISLFITFPLRGSHCVVDGVWVVLV